MENSRYNDFNALVNNALKSMNKIKFMNLTEYGLSSAHITCLLHIFSNNAHGVTKTQLATLCEVDKSQITRVIGYLTEKRFVKNFEDNAFCIYKKKHALTEKGLKVVLEIKDTIVRVNTFVSKEISKADLEVFYRTFNLICQNLKRVEEGLENGD